jgi:hypothetical protein
MPSWKIGTVDAPNHALIALGNQDLILPGGRLRMVGF